MEFYTVTLWHIHCCNYRYSVIDGWGSHKIYRLSDDEREWTEVGEIPEQRDSFGVASLNGKIYITGGGRKSLTLYDKCCIIIYLVGMHSNPVCVSIPQLQLAVEFLKSLI